jgi:sulfur-oxidizing protein SoxY
MSDPRARPLQLDRRALLGAGLSLVLAPVAPVARAQVQGMGMAPGKQMAEAITAFAQGQPVRTGRVQLEIAELVDNGNAVPVRVRVDSPMTAANHVQQIALFSDRNPQRDIAIFTLGPRTGLAQVATRIRLATSQQVSAVARMNDGSVWVATVDVIVVLAACIEVEV